MFQANLFTRTCAPGDIDVSLEESAFARGGGGVIGGEGNCSLCPMTGERASKVTSRISFGLKTIDNGNILTKNTSSRIHVSGQE